MGVRFNKLWIFSKIYMHVNHISLSLNWQENSPLPNEVTRTELLRNPKVPTKLRREIDHPSFVAIRAYSAVAAAKAWTTSEDKVESGKVTRNLPA